MAFSPFAKGILQKETLYDPVDNIYRRYDDNKDTPFLFCCRHGTNDAIDPFLEMYPVAPNTKDKLGNNALHLLANNPKALITKKIWEWSKTLQTVKNPRGKLPFDPDSNGNYYLHKIRPTVRTNILDLEDAINQFKDTILKQNNKGETALYLAVDEDNDILANCLIKENRLLDIKANNGKTPLILAIEKGNKKIARQLILEGATGLDDAIGKLFDRALLLREDSEKSLEYLLLQTIVEKDPTVMKSAKKEAKRRKLDEKIISLFTKIKPPSRSTTPKSPSPRDVASEEALAVKITGIKI